ncbi:class I SAM-dependent methyltransferase [Siccirubricoccus sp. KC 17139]|uniref:Class I SAM-dependent methyltransferase n=1 Tax=Siccirubricoccus soli TaxID=2899147 RepID=A0ABT1D1T9_9PROT|nr:class I SAM-dependent methyltransferase [Siccirubricoccus soli]MCO6414990.1 class I SAM-dependent methyltransferase [Siccirubricoccus soli]MCP2681121.1 class I SAM-dependent methyltransferase [Siccirubricoccus soli]
MVMAHLAEEAARPRRLVEAPRGLSRGMPVPWYIKLGVKLGLAAIGVHGARARMLGLARPSFGASDPAKLVGTPQAWFQRATELLGRRPRTLLEVGPGRMVLRAPLLAGLGAECIWFVDPSDSAPREAGPYLAAAATGRLHGVMSPDLSGCADRAAVLARSHARLLIGGPAALSAIPDGSVDLVVSEAVLEHVRREDLAPLMAQLRRVTAPDGLGLHTVDFQDHLGGGLQHLRFSDQFWASPLVGRAGIYVNRLGLSAMASRFRRAGFAVQVTEAVVWPKRPPGPRRPHPDAMRPAGDDLVARATLELRPG